MSDETYLSGTSSRRYRPNRRLPSEAGQRSGSADAALGVLTPDLAGASAAYGDTLLFFGYEVEGKMEIVVYPRYRFPSDDRVQGHLANLRFAPGTPLTTIMEEIDRTYQLAQENYRLAATARSAELRAHGARYESAYDTICEIFRESWHGFSLRLRREGSFTKEGVYFEGRPPGPVLVKWRSESYTLLVATTGSIMLLSGDRRTNMPRPR